MPTKPKINVRLLRRIQKQIAKEPRQFYMGWWFKSGDTLPYKVPNCNTAACIGGWALSLTLKVSPKVGDFSAFIADMGERPPGTSIERINNDGDYCPENCRWATRSEQGFNTRRNRIITFGGKSLPLNAWAVKLGINSGTLRSRIDREGWDVKSALTIPVRKIKVSV